MKYLTLTIFFSVLLNSLISQSITDSLEWSNAFQDAGLSNLFLETDSLDNIYTVGVYHGCSQCFVLWNTDTIISQGNGSKDIFISKIDKDGNLIWFDLIGGEGDELLIGFRSDSESNFLIFVENDEEFSYLGDDLQVGYNLLKIDVEGELIWSLNISGSTHNRHNSIYPFFREQISISCSNEILIGGSIRTIDDTNVILDTIIFGTDTIFQYLQVFDTLVIGNESFIVDTNNVFVAKISSIGTLEWVRIFEHTRNIRISSIWADGDKDINVLGYYQYEDLIINNDTLPIDTFGYSQKRNVILLKIKSDGTLKWVKKYFDDVVTTNLILDTEGNIIATGYFYQTTYYEQDTITSNGVQDILIFKVDSLGNYLWGLNAGNNATNQRCNLITNSNNEIFLSGDIGLSYNTIINKYSPDGGLLYELEPEPGLNVHGGDLVYDNSGSLIHTGIYQGTFIMSNDTLTPATSGDWDQYILKFKGQTEVNDIVDCSDEITLLNEKLNEKLKFQIFPNPTAGMLNIVIPDLDVNKIELFIYDLQGRRMLYGNYMNQDKLISIDLNDLIPSIYILKIVTEEYIDSKTFIVINNFD